MIQKIYIYTQKDRKPKSWIQRTTLLSDLYSNLKFRTPLPQRVSRPCKPTRYPNRDYELAQDMWFEWQGHISSGKRFFFFLQVGEKIAKFESENFVWIELWQRKNNKVTWQYAEASSGP